MYVCMYDNKKMYILSISMWVSSTYNPETILMYGNCDSCHTVVRQSWFIKPLIFNQIPINPMAGSSINLNAHGPLLDYVV